MISGPAMWKNCALLSLATARARRVLPVPGGPRSRTPLGGAPPRPRARPGGGRGGRGGLAGARRTVQQNALGRVDPQALEQLGMAKRQFDHLAKAVDGVA